ncbi:MAG: DMT family transporter [Acidimicrobiia bacterium]
MMFIEGNPSHARAVASALLVTFLWSSSWVLIRWGLDSEDLEPIGFAALRYGVAALFLIGWAASTQPIRHHLAHLDRRAAALIGLGANVTSALLGRHVNRQSAVPPVVVTTWSMATGAAILFAVAVAFEGVPTVSPRGWLIILWLALVNTALAFTLWNLSLRRLSALESAAINNTLLIQIAVLAWILLDEMPGRGELIGIALVSVGILLTQGRGAGLARSLRPRLR